MLNGKIMQENHRELRSRQLVDTIIKCPQKTKNEMRSGH